MLISRKVTEVSEISHVNLRAGWKELTKPINFMTVCVMCNSFVIVE